MIKDKEEFRKRIKKNGKIHVSTEFLLPIFKTFLKNYDVYEKLLARRDNYILGIIIRKNFNEELLTNFLTMRSYSSLLYFFTHILLTPMNTSKMDRDEKSKWIELHQRWICLRSKIVFHNEIDGIKENHSLIIYLIRNN